MCVYIGMLLLLLLLLILCVLDTETAIMHKLQSVLMEHSDALMSVIECTTELDW